MNTAGANCQNGHSFIEIMILPIFTQKWNSTHEISTNKYY